jgi:hypothetical protein
MRQRTIDFALSLPITQAARRKAQEFAAQQPSSEKAEQVRLNTLAVLVVNDYLEMMDISTDLSASDSWNGIMRLCTDVADIQLLKKDGKLLGHLECRPVGPGVDTCYVPPETWEERVGYVVVQIDESVREAQLLGFVPEVTTEELPLSWLRSPEDLLEHLHHVSVEVDLAAATVSTESNTDLLTNLGRWFDRVFETGWQTVEDLLTPAQLEPAYAYRFRGSIRRAKTLDLSPQLPQPVALIVELTTETMEQRVEQTIVKLQLQPIGNQPLPAQINLAILDDSNQIITTGASNQVLEVRGVSGERFSFRATFNDTQVLQEFVI